MRRFAAAAAGAVLCTTVAGCSMLRGKEARACPQATVVAELGSLQAYRDGPGRDLTDLRFAAALVDLDGSCKYDSRGVEIEMTLAVVGERGPALDADKIELEYFVAITGPDQRILVKKSFRTTLDFAGGRRRTGSGEELVERIPLPPKTDAGDYSIAVGFQLTPEQLETNRRRGG